MAKRRAGTVIEWVKGGGYIRQPYKRCPQCHGEVDWASDEPNPGDETQGCVGYVKNRGPDYNDACPEENGCGWEMVMEHYPEVPPGYFDESGEE